MIIINSGVWTGIITLLISVTFFFLSLAFPYSATIGPGPGFFPIWITGILIVFSILYILVSIKQGSKEEYDFPNASAFKNILFILISMSLFVVLLSFLGFVLSGTLFLFILLVREYKWYSSLAISLGVSLFFFWLFGLVLKISLPVNFLGW